jgi:hypothetical protein
MDANGVDKSKIFAMSADDAAQVDPLAMMNFLDELYPNLRPKNDMIVCIPGPDADGNLKMEATFSFCFHYPPDRRSGRRPMPGLVHNVDHTAEGSEQAVEGDYYITSNVKGQMIVDNDETNVATILKLCHSEEFLPRELATPVVPHSLNGDGGGQSPVYRSLRDIVDEEDYEGWIDGCKALQAKARAAYWKSIAEFCTKTGLPDFDDSNFYSTNLVGLSLAKNATSVVLGKDAPEHEGASVILRIKAARAASAMATEARANKRRASDSVDSPDGVNGMDVAPAP